MHTLNKATLNKTKEFSQPLFLELLCSIIKYNFLQTCDDKFAQLEAIDSVKSTNLTTKKASTHSTEKCMIEEWKQSLNTMRYILVQVQASSSYVKKI